MKYEITKGSEKDFEGAGEKVLTVYSSPNLGRYFSSLPSGDARPPFVSVIAERRPITEPAWDGAVVPCVGQKVMTKSGEGIIDYVGSGVIVYSNDDGQWSVRCDSLDYALSAIRSPKDVSKDEGIEAMRDVVLSSDQSLTCYESLYDAIAAGKIPGITKTPTASQLMRVTEKATREDCEAIVKLLSGK